MNAGGDKRDLRVVIMGAGMAGILAGIRFREAGYENLTIYEKADRIGGTWRENRYPGLTCDIPSHAYTYSFAPNPDWTRQFPAGPEIFDYFAGVVDSYGLDEAIRYGEEIEACVREGGAWRLTAKSGLTDTADVVVAATGFLHHPKYPDIVGLESFAGARFHSARWDQDVPLDDRRVGVIGNGSTGVQIVSALAGRAAALTHFQRTPQWIMPAVNTLFTEEERAAFRVDPALMRELHHGEAAQGRLRFFSRAITDASSPEMAMVEQVALANLENSVADPVLREKLRPAYRAACKRMIMSPDYYQKVQTPGVEVVREAIAAVEPEGVRTRDGRLHPLDVLVLATGFKADHFMRPMKVIGRGGADLETLWLRRPSAYLALSVPDFPNLFLVNGPSAPFGNYSSIGVAEEQVDYILKLLDMTWSAGAREVSVRREVMADYDAQVKEAAKGTIFASGCSSWYLDADGVPSIWPWTYDHFKARMARPDVTQFELAA